MSIRVTAVAVIVLFDIVLGIMLVILVMGRAAAVFYVMNCVSFQRFKA